MKRLDQIGGYEYRPYNPYDHSRAIDVELLARAIIICLMSTIFHFINRRAGLFLAAIAGRCWARCPLKPT